MIVVKNENYTGKWGGFLDLAINGTVFTLTLYEVKPGAFYSADFNIEDYLITSVQTFDLNQIFRPYSKFGVVLDKMKEMSGIVDLDAIYTSRDGFTAMNTFAHITDQLVVLLYFHDSPSNYVMTTHLVTRTNVPYTLNESKILFNNVVLGQIPAASTVFSNVAAKQTLLTSIDPNTSLSGLEAQVDILSSLVFALLDAQATTAQQEIATAIPQVAEFRSACATHNLTSVKPIEACLQEIRNVKGLIRFQQQQYYAAKAKNTLVAPTFTIARVVNGVVSWVFQTTSTLAQVQTKFPTNVGTFVDITSVSPQPSEGWGYNGTTFTQPTS